MKAIDTHAHVFSTAGPFAAGARYVPAYEATLAQWFSLQDASGVSQGVLVQPSFYGTDNRLLLAALQAHPRRLRGVVVVDPSVDRAVLARWDAAGVRGIRLNLWGGAPLPALASADWQVLFEAIGALGWHVELHVEHGRLDEVLRSIGRAPLARVIDHFGRPGAGTQAMDDLLRAIDEHASAQPVYVKLSAPYRVAGDAAGGAARLLDALGASRLMWGSDWPWTNFEGRHTYADCRRWLDAWIPDPDARMRVLFDTPARLFRFPVSGEGP